MALSKTTQDHDEIRKWAESHGAIPTEVSSTGSKNSTGILRFAFPKAKGHNDDKLNEISWEDFFEKFDSNDLELIYQEKTAAGEKSNFNKLVHPEHDEEHSRHKSKTKSGHTEHKTEHKAESKAEHKADHKAESKADHKTEHKADHKAESKTEHKTEHKTAHK